MTPAQSTAFATASGQLPGSIRLGVAAVVITFAILWLAWMSWQLFHAWRNGSAEFGSLAWYTLRGSMVLMILGYFIS